MRWAHQAPRGSREGLYSCIQGAGLGLGRSVGCCGGPAAGAGSVPGSEPAEAVPSVGREQQTGWQRVLVRRIHLGQTL